MEAGTKAFLSYVRAYKEHHCKFIFRMQVGGCTGVWWACIIVAGHCLVRRVASQRLMR